MKTEDLLFWRDFPVNRQKSFFQAVVVAVAAAAFLVWLSLYLATGEALQRADAVRENQAKVQSLVAEASALETKAAALANLTPLAAAQQVARDMGLEKRISSIRPSQIGGNQEGVQMYFEGLNLPDLVGLLGNLKNRGGLKLVSCSLSHRLDVPDLADLQLVMVR